MMANDANDDDVKTQVLAKFPRTTIVASDLDPCLDENVQFSSMLVEAGAQVLTLSLTIHVDNFECTVPSPIYLC